jgi:hypothetical protein
MLSDMSKKKSEMTTWGHHDSMIVNLRDWVTREITLLRNDVAKDAPKLEAPIGKLLKSAEDLNLQMFDLIRAAAEMAEKEAKKKTAEE